MGANGTLVPALVSGLVGLVVAGPAATAASAAGQGLSDRIAHCERTRESASRVRELSAQIARPVPAAESFAQQVALGRARIADCDFVGALAGFDRAVRIKPRTVPLSVAFYIGRGDARLRLEQRDLALADYAAALSGSPNADDEAHIYQMRGFIHSDKGEEALAIADFSRLILLKPDFADAYWFRAVSYENVNDYENALADYDQLARLRPDDWTTWAEACWGHAYLDSGLLEGLRACDIALQLNPGDSNTLDGRGFVNFRLGRFPAAIADYDAALQQNPRIPSSLYLRGIAKLSLGDAPGGQQDLSAAQRLEPEIASRFAGYGIAP